MRLRTAAARQAGEGQQTKMELVYQYLTGPRFRQRIEAIVEKFSGMALCARVAFRLARWWRRDSILPDGGVIRLWSAAEGKH